MGYRLFIWWIRRHAQTVILARCSRALRLEMKKRKFYARLGKPSPSQQ